MKGVVSLVWSSLLLIPAFRYAHALARHGHREYEFGFCTCRLDPLYCWEIEVSEDGEMEELSRNGGVG